MGKKHSRAVVLIMVLCVLTILFLMGVTFVLITRLERQVARNFVIQVRAKLAAQSGIHFAMTQTRNLLHTPTPLPPKARLALSGGKRGF